MVMNAYEKAAADTIARWLSPRLTAPRVYYDAEWPGLEFGRVALVLIDRDGEGDAHLVQIRRRAPDALERCAALLGTEAAFRWVAFHRGTEDIEATMALISQKPLFRPMAEGRIGVVELFTNHKKQRDVRQRLGAERFAANNPAEARKFARGHDFVQLDEESAPPASEPVASPRRLRGRKLKRV